MKIEPRFKIVKGKQVIRGLVLVSEDEEESKQIDELFGSQVDDDGLIGTGTVEARLSDGYGEHYLYLQANEKK